MNLTALKAELTDDPLGRGYSGMSESEAAASLNAVNRNVNVEAVTGQEIFEATVPADYDALPAKDKPLYAIIVGLGTILVNGTNTKARLVAMFAGTPTLSALAVLQKHLVSRAAELGLGHVGGGNVTQARK